MQVNQKSYQGKIKAVIFDWAGTTVDYGCFAPAIVFVEIFRKKGIEITIDEARAPMGLMKWDHIKTLCQMDRIKAIWIDRFGKQPTEADIDSLYKDFQPLLLDVLPKYSDSIPGVVELMESLRKKGIKIGSTTGYTTEMLEIVAKEAKKKGYQPDAIVTSSDVPAGRPHPWMCFQNALKLGVYPPEAIIKVGDTVSDIKEGINAGMWSVGVIKGGNELGLSETEAEGLNKNTLNERMSQVHNKFKLAGAHYVINSISELEAIIDLMEL